MGLLPSFNEMEPTSTEVTPCGSVDASVAPDLPSVEKLLEPVDKSPVVVSEQREDELRGTSTKPEKFKYEFSLVIPKNTPMFVVLYDTSDVSAVERVTGVRDLPIIYNTDTGNGFVDCDGMRYVFKKDPFGSSATFMCGAEEPVARPTKRKTLPTPNDILAGLV